MRRPAIQGVGQTESGTHHVGFEQATSGRHPPRHRPSSTAAGAMSPLLVQRQRLRAAAGVFGRGGRPTSAQSGQTARASLANRTAFAVLFLEGPVQERLAFPERRVLVSFSLRRAHRLPHHAFHSPGGQGGCRVSRDGAVRTSATWLSLLSGHRTVLRGVIEAWPFTRSAAHLLGIGRPSCNGLQMSKNEREVATRRERRAMNRKKKGAEGPAKFKVRIESG